MRCACACAMASSRESSPRAAKPAAVRAEFTRDLDVAADDSCARIPGARERTAAKAPPTAMPRASRLIRDERDQGLVMVISLGHRAGWPLAEYLLNRSNSKKTEEARSRSSGAAPSLRTSQR